MKETTIITYNSDSSDIGVLEVDPNLNLDSSGNVKTSFNAGDQVYLSIHYDRNKYRVVSAVASSGELQFRGTQVGRREISRQFFSDSVTVDLQYIINSIVAVKWYGSRGTIQADYNTLRASIVPCIVDVTISVISDIYLYVPDQSMDLSDPDADFPVGVKFELEEI